MIARRSKEDLTIMQGLLEAGKVTPVIDRTNPLSEVPELSGIWKKDKLEEK